jgi:tRNA threonylcarbamoyl adenosine modification protein (Sua5/YciO/YrdC/YwlC family)
MFDSLMSAGLAALLRQGAVGVLPTDTIYGIVAAAQDKAAVERLYKIKHREGKPGTLVAANVAQLEALGIERRYLDAVAHLWPNPISIVVPAGESLAYLHQGKDSLAVRIPRDEQLQALLIQTGPLLTSSANHPGEPAADTFADAEAYFGSEVDFYVDGGDVSGRSPSTVALLSQDGSLVVLRQGEVTVVDE